MGGAVEDSGTDRRPVLLDAISHRSTVVNPAGPGENDRRGRLERVQRRRTRPPRNDGPTTRVMGCSEFGQSGQVGVENCVARLPRRESSLSLFRRSQQERYRMSQVGGAHAGEARIRIEQDEAVDVGRPTESERQSDHRAVRVSENRRSPQCRPGEHIVQPQHEVVDVPRGFTRRNRSPHVTENVHRDHSVATTQFGRLAGPGHRGRPGSGEQYDRTTVGGTGRGDMGVAESCRHHRRGRSRRPRSEDAVVGSSELPPLGRSMERLHRVCHAAPRCLDGRVIR